MSIRDALIHLAVQALAQRVRALTGSKSDLTDFELPLGDKGLFGPASVTWRVHANFTVMMVGGLSSLMVQALHPRALSAVWDHSDFRNKLKDRLGRTAYFVAATTYGGESLAMGAIRRVNAIHARIRGTDEHGTLYIANEPELIRWVHLAEVCSFLCAYQHLAKVPLSQVECDHYVEEMNQIGHLLGAVDLPVTWAATQAALLDYSSVLRFDDRAKETLRVVEHYPTDLLEKPFMQLTLSAAFDVMPAWVLQVIGKPPACMLQKQATQCALMAASEPIQWMLDKQGVRAVALRRVQGRAASI